MKKYILTIMLFSLGFAGYAQVGIGTASPTLTLEVVGANDNGAVTGVDGVLVPRVNDTDMSSATAGTKEGQMVYNTVAKKFYYWNGTAWTAVGGVPVVTEDMTSSPDSGTEVAQLVYSTNASSTGYYYWTGAAWTPLVPAGYGIATGSITSTLGITNVDDPGPYTVLDSDRVINVTFDDGSDYILSLPDPSSHTGRMICIISSAFTQQIQFSTNSPTGGTQIVPSGGASLVISNGAEWKLLRAGF